MGFHGIPLVTSAAIPNHLPVKPRDLWVNRGYQGVIQPWDNSVGEIYWEIMGNSGTVKYQLYMV